MRTVATICARGGSEGVPGKNLRSLLGKPLIVWTIEQALQCPEIDGVYVSTDSPAIAEVARGAGALVPFLRPGALATSEAPKIPVIEHLINTLEGLGQRFDRIVDLDPTSPLRNLDDIRKCIDLLDSDTDVVITGFESEKNPYFNMVRLASDGTASLVCRPDQPVVARQQAPHVYSMNGSVYVWHRLTLAKGLWGGKERLHVMPRERSIDIDTPLDFRFVEMLMGSRKEP